MSNSKFTIAAAARRFYLHLGLSLAFVAKILFFLDLRRSPELVARDETPIQDSQPCPSSSTRYLCGGVVVVDPAIGMAAAKVTVLSRVARLAPHLERPEQGQALRVVEVGKIVPGKGEGQEAGKSRESEDLVKPRQRVPRQVQGAEHGEVLQDVRARKAAVTSVRTTAHVRRELI